MFELFHLIPNLANYAPNNCESSHTYLHDLLKPKCSFVNAWVWHVVALCILKHQIEISVNLFHTFVLSILHLCPWNKLKVYSVHSLVFCQSAQCSLSFNQVIDPSHTWSAAERLAVWSADSSRDTPYERGVVGRAQRRSGPGCSWRLLQPQRAGRLGCSLPY